MFLARLSLDVDPQPGYWVVREPLTWNDAFYGRLTIPRGFRTDLASYPRVLRNLPCFDVDGLSREAAAMHDWLYAWYRVHRFDSKRYADSFLLRALLISGVKPRCAWTTYLGVHWFGRWSWDGDAGALESRDFDTRANYMAWLESLPSVETSG